MNILRTVCAFSTLITFTVFGATSLAYCLVKGTDNAVAGNWLVFGGFLLAFMTIVACGVLFVMTVARRI